MAPRGRTLATFQYTYSLFAPQEECPVFSTPSKVITGARETYNDSIAGVCGELSELVVVVVLGRTQVGLTSRQSLLHLHVEETVVHTETLLLPGEVVNDPLF